MPRLFQIRYSPWSERARWALDHHGITYEKIEHVPMLGEPRIRLAAKRWRGKTSVPIFVDGDLVIDDSVDIAKHADRLGKGATLFPKGKDAQIEQWVSVAERLGEAGRAVVVARIQDDPEVQRESIPRSMPAFLAPMAVMGASFVARKYKSNLSEKQAFANVRTALTEVRESLAGRDYLLDDFSFADVTIASFMQMVSPVADEYIRLGKATRRAWTAPDLAEDFADLVRWRDDVYRRHRRSGKPAH